MYESERGNNWAPEGGARVHVYRGARKALGTLRSRFARKCLLLLDVLNPRVEHFHGPQQRDSCRIASGTGNLEVSAALGAVQFQLPPCQECVQWRDHQSALIGFENGCHMR